MKLRIGKPKWSERSAASIREEKRLQAEVERYATLEKNVEAEIVGLERDKEANLEAVARGHSDRALSDALAKLEDAKRKVKAYREAAQASRSLLAKFRDEVATQAPKRSKRQEELAALVHSRVVQDELIDAALASLRKGLSDREELTDRIKELGGELEFNMRDWDADRFAALLRSLPETVLDQSRQWLAWFLGDKSANHLGSYVVCAKQGAVVAETLAHSGMLQFGDSVRLSEDQARDLLRYDRRNPAWRPSWNDGQARFLSPSLMPKDEWERLEAEATQTGQSIDMTLFLAIQKRHRELEEEAGRPEIAKPNDSADAVGLLP